MSRDAVFTTATTWTRWYGNFLKEVINEIGLERAIELHAKHGKDSWKNYVNESKEKGPFNPKVLAAYLGPSYEKRGVINLEIEATSNSLVLRNGRCPIYDGFKMAGLADEIINKLCTNREGMTISAITEAFPEVKASHTRDKPDGYCKIVYELK
jgi:hypothetical protein